MHILNVLPINMCAMHSFMYNLLKYFTQRTHIPFIHFFLPFIHYSIGLEYFIMIFESMKIIKSDNKLGVCFLINCY